MSLHPAMTFSSGSSLPSTSVRAPKLLPVTDAHFANFVRRLEDERHARMLHSILTRPYEKRTGVFHQIENHDFFSRTLAMRKRNARSYREFGRQKENLLLLQRLQQIHCDEHPAYSRSRVGKSYSKDWEKHEAKHAAVRARLISRPRVGSSAIFAESQAASPLSPRNRQAWEGKRVEKYRDTTLERDPRELPPRASGPDGRRARPASALPSSRTATGTAASIEAERMAAERQSIEAELQRRWDILEQQSSHPSDFDEKDSLDPAFEAELGLGPDLEDASIDAWLRAHSNGGFAAPSDGQTNRHTGSQVISPRPSDQAIDTARQRSVRARYIDPEEDDADIGSEYADEAQHTASSSTTPALHSSLYALATDPHLARDETVDQYRLHQYAQSLPPDVRRHAPHRPGSSSRPRPPPLSPSHSSSSVGSFHPTSSGVHSHEEVDSVLDVLSEFEDIHAVAAHQRPRSPQPARRPPARGRTGAFQSGFSHARTQSTSSLRSNDSIASSVPSRSGAGGGRHSRGSSASSAAAAFSIYASGAASSAPARRSPPSGSPSFLPTGSSPSVPSRPRPSAGGAPALSAAEQEADAYLRQLAEQFPNSSRARANHREHDGQSRTADQPPRQPHPPARPPTQQGFMKATFNTKQYAAQAQPRR